MSNANSLETEAIPPPTPTEESTLTLAQERLWFLERLHPGSPVNNLSTALRLKGMLHLPALIRSLSGVIQRHEVLRMTIQPAQGRP